MLKDYLKETYGYNEPIFINEIKLEYFTDNALRQSFKRMVKYGELIRFDTGIYYLPDDSRLLKKTYLDPLKVISCKYVQRNSDIFGYFSGAFFANQLGLTTQMPAVIEIVTNKESTKGRTVTIGGQSVRLKHSSIDITKENAALLQFLDIVTKIEKYTELTINDAAAVLRQYIQKYNFSKTQLAGVLSAVTAQTAKKLIEWGLIYEFA